MCFIIRLILSRNIKMAKIAIKTANTNSLPWPHDLSYKAYKKFSPASEEWVCKSVYELRSDQISIQNQKIGLEKISKILRATFKLSASQGFHSMSLRELSKESGISLGGIYAYIGSKEELANLIEHVLSVIASKLTDLAIAEVNSTKEKLTTLIHNHIYLSEQLHPWFYFVFMESKSLSKLQKEKAKKTELDYEERFKVLIKQGIKEGIFKCDNIELASSAILASLQDWHLKRWKHRKRNTTPDLYAKFITDSYLKQLEV